MRVVDAAGAPVPGASVHAFAPAGSGSPFTALTHRLIGGETNDEGRLPAPLPLLDGLLLVVDHPQHGPLIHVGRPPERLVLPPGRTLAGRATVEPAADEADSATAVVREGEVCADWTTRFGPWRWSHRWRRCAPLDAEGRFALGGVGEGPLEVEARVAGFLPARRTLAAGAKPGDLRLQLEPGILLAGTVTDAAGGPLAGAAVAGPEGEVASRRDGGFELAVAALPVEVTASAPGHRAVSRRVERPDEASALRLSLPPAQQVHGALLGAGGEPLPEGELWAERHRPPERWSLERLRFATLGGELRVDLPAPGRYRLALTAPGHRATRLPEVEIASGEVVEVGAVALSRGATVSGTVVDAESGTALAGASLRLLPLGHAALAALRRAGTVSGTSDAAGVFVVAGLDAGEYELRVSRSGYADLLTEVALPHDRATDLGELRLGPGVELGGRVVDRRGQARGGLRVELSAPSGLALEPMAAAVTGDDGRFGGISTQPGRYRLRLVGERPLLSQEVVVPEDAVRHQVELVLPSVRLVGEVLDGGVPVRGGLLALSSDLDPGWRRGAVLIETAGRLDPGRTASGIPTSMMTAEVGTDGRFTVEDAPAGPLTVTYYGAGGEPYVERLTVPDQAEAAVVIELAGERLAGTVADAESGAPLVAELRLHDAAGRTVAAGRSGADGRFGFDRLDVQPYRLEVAASGYRTVTVTPASPGHEPLAVTLEAEAAGRLVVRLARADGSPAAHVQVTLLGEAGHKLRSLPTDAAGVRELDDLAAGSYFVVWTDPASGTGTSGPVTVTAGETAWVDELLAPGSPLVLTCDPSRCAGDAVAALALYSDAGIDLGAYLPLVDIGLRFSAEGALPIGRLSPGRYLLRVWTVEGRRERLLDVDGAPLVVPL